MSTPQEGREPAEEVEVVSEEAVQEEKKVEFTPGQHALRALGAWVTGLGLEQGKSSVVAMQKIENIRDGKAPPSPPESFDQLMERARASEGVSVQDVEYAMSHPVLLLPGGDYYPLFPGADNEEYRHHHPVHSRRAPTELPSMETGTSTRSDAWRKRRERRRRGSR